MRAIPVDVGTAVGHLDLDISGFLSGLQTAQTQAESQSKSMAEKIGAGFTTVGKGLTTAGTSLTKNVTAPVMAAGTAAVKTAADFDSAMSKVSAISKAEGADFDRLRAKAIEMGAATKFSATESAEAFTYMAMAGWDTEQMLDGIDGIMALAAADGLDLATTSDIVTDALTAFGLEASDSAHFADVLAAASSSANTNVSMLGESFKYVAPIAGSMKYSVEDVGVALGLMANAGIKGSQAGTALRQGLAQMIKPTDDAAELMEKYSLSLFDSEGHSKDLMSVMKDLRGTFGNVSVDLAKATEAAEAGEDAWAEYAASLPISEQEKLQALTEIFGVRAMPAMLAIINTAEDDFNDLAASINNADGEAKRMSDRMLQNLNGQITILKSNLETLAIQVGDILMPYVSKAVAKFQEFVVWLQNADEQTKRNAIRFALIAAAIGPLLLVLGKLVTGFGNLFFAFNNIKKGIAAAKAGFAALKVAIGGISGPVVAIVAIVALMVAAFKHLWDTNEEFRNRVTTIWNGIEEKFREFTQGIVDRLNALGFNFESIVDVLKGLWEGFCAILAPVFEGAFQLVSDALETIFGVLTGLLDVFVGLFTGNWEQMWSGLGTILSSLWSGLKNILKTGLDTLLGIFDAVCGLFGTTWAEVWSSIKNFFVETWASLVSWFQGTLTGIKTFFVNIWEGISSFAQSVWNTITDVVRFGVMFIGEIISAAFQIITLPFRFIWENCKEEIAAAWEAISSVVKDALAAISATISKAWNTIKSALEKVLNAIKSKVETIWSNISNKISSTVSSIKDKVSTTFETVKNNLSTVWDNIKSTASSVWNGIRSVVETPMNNAKNTITNIATQIHSAVTSKFNAVKSTVTSIFNSIQSTISNVMNSARNAVSNAIDNIKSKFNFSWSLPHLSLPHISISGRFSISPPSVPHFSISWYAKAMRNGMILDAPTIFGFDPKSGQFMGAGEAGSETIVGTQSLMEMIQKAVKAAINNLESQIASYCAAIADMFLASSKNLLLGLGRVYDIANAFVGMLDQLDDQLIGKMVAQGKVDKPKPSNSDKDKFDYDQLAYKLAEVFRKAPVEHHVEVEMEDGDVYLDNERVGRKVAPVVSRVQATS